MWAKRSLREWAAAQTRSGKGFPEPLLFWELEEVSGTERCIPHNRHPREGGDLSKLLKLLRFHTRPHRDFAGQRGI